MTTAGETARNNGMKLCMKGELFADRYLNLFPLFFFSFTLSPCQLHRDSENLFACLYLNALDFGCLFIFQG